MLKSFAISALLALGVSGCASTSGRPQSAQPDRAILYRDSVNVIMSEGSLCVGNRPGRAHEWTGRLSGCPYLYVYDVRGASDTAPPRRVLQKQTGDAAQAPVRVSVTDDKGQSTVFAAP